jgi:hypothetical protein
MDRFTADLRQVSNLNMSLLALRPVTAAPVKPLGSFEKASLSAALAMGKGLDPRLSLMADTVAVGEKPPAVSILPPTKPPTGLTVSKSTDLTVALGVGGAAFALFGSVASAGVYGSTTREIGVYLTFGIGLFLPAVGVSGGAEMTFIFGTPADFKGPYLSAGISVSAGPVAAIGGALLFSPGPPPVLMGYSITFTANTPSVLPVTIALEVTDTKTKPVLRF